MVLLGLACLALSTGSPGVAQAQPRVLVLPALSIDGPPSLALEARAAADRALRAQGAEPAALPNLSADELACRNGDCLADLGRRAGASSVLRLEASYGRDSYQLQVELWRVADETLADKRDRQCEICTADDLHKAIRELVTLAYVRAASAPAPTVAPPAATPPDLATEGVPPRPSTSTWPRAVWGGAALAGGLALLGTGLYLVSRDGDGACSMPDPSRGGCPRVYDTKTQGWAAAAVGVGLTAVGAWGLVPFFMPSREGEVMAGLIVEGAF